MKSKLEIYALSVCFASVVCLAVASGIGAYAIVEVVVPEFTVSPHVYDDYQANDAYWLRENRCYADDCVVPARPADDVLTEQRQRAVSGVIKAERRRGFQTLLKSLIFILVAGLALLIHWKIAKKSCQ